MCTLNSQHDPTTGGPLDAVDETSGFRMLLLAHELGIVDVLGRRELVSGGACGPMKS